MKFAKTMLIVGAGIGAGMVVANYLTDGAVFEAVSTIYTNVKDGIMDKSKDVVDVVADVAENTIDTVTNII